MMDLDNLQQNLGVVFRDPALLRQALVHPSYANEHPEEVAGSNQRLEFLGDACLGLVVARELYRRHGELEEGALTEARSRLVREETLAKVARTLKLGEHLLLGRGEGASGGHDRDSTQADAFEAVVGAILLDRGYRAAQEFVLRVLRSEMRSMAEAKSFRDPKSRLQELAHAMGAAVPTYQVASAEGPPHRPTYTIEVLWDGEVMGIGQGRRKIDAERKAASQALEKLS